MEYTHNYRKIYALLSWNIRTTIVKYTRFYHKIYAHLSHFIRTTIAKYTRAAQCVSPSRIYRKIYGYHPLQPFFTIIKCTGF